MQASNPIKSYQEETKKKEQNNITADDGTAGQKGGTVSSDTRLLRDSGSEAGHGEITAHAHHKTWH